MKDGWQKIETCPRDGTWVLLDLDDGNLAEARFWAVHFRPVVERKTETGMAILREILDRETHQDKPPVKRTVHS